MIRKVKFTDFGSVNPHGISFSYEFQSLSIALTDKMWKLFDTLLSGLCTPTKIWQIFTGEILKREASLNEVYKAHRSKFLALINNKMTEFYLK